MKLFIVVLIFATIVGGLAGGEIMNMSFSVLGAAIGGVGTAAILLGLGAYFDAQEKKKSPDMSPEMRRVFDRLVTGKANPTEQEVEDAKRAVRRAAKR